MIFHLDMKVTKVVTLFFKIIKKQAFRLIFRLKNILFRIILIIDLLFTSKLTSRFD